MAVSFDCFQLLPLELFATIISLLSFKDAVKTSVLSKEWLNRWKTTTNIEFNELFFVKLDQPDETREAQRKTFLEFIKFCIDNHVGTVVDKFSLTLSTPGNVGEIVDGCVAFATERGVKALELDFADVNRNEKMVYFEDYEALLELPAQVYQHRSLESLKLYSCSFVDAEMRNIRALKEVSLGWMEVKLTSIKDLLTNCKMLESLSFKKCWNSDKFDLGEEQNTRLRKLVVDKCRFNFDFFNVNAVNLQVFKYCGLMSFLTIQIRSFVMEEADLDFSPEYGFERHGHPLCNLVENLHTARVLTVCSFVLQVIPSGRRIRNMHVQHLIMKTAFHENEFMGITFFLNSCPMLERLTIEICSEKDLFDYEAPYYFNRNQFWVENVGLYACLSSSLEVVEINGFRGTSNEHLVINYLMVCGVVLKKISINTFKDDFGNVESHCRKRAEILLKAPRASGNLEISIC